MDWDTGTGREVCHILIFVWHDLGGVSIAQSLPMASVVKKFTLRPRLATVARA